MDKQPTLWQSVRGKLPFLTVLAVSSALCLLLFVCRFLYSGQITYGFLIWNLFLAWIPLVCALMFWLVANPHRPTLWLALPILGGWLLFFPNTLYIISDLIHLAPRGRVPVWYDALVLFSFAWNGLMLGLTSLWIVQRVIDQWLGRVAGWLWVGLTIGLTGFGVYLGRFLRWNSWDLLTEPGALLTDIAEHVLNPMQHPRTIVVTAIFSSFTIVAYLTLTTMVATRWERPTH